jgi:hypothetical protein
VDDNIIIGIDEEHIDDKQKFLSSSTKRCKCCLVTKWLKEKLSGKNIVHEDTYGIQKVDGEKLAIKDQSRSMRIFYMFLHRNPTVV